MKIIGLLPLFLFISPLGLTNSNEFTGHLEAEFNYQYHWQPEAVVQPWAIPEPWQPNINTRLGLEKNGAAVTVELDTEQLSLKELYLDFSTGSTQWSVGIKPQEWSYAFSDSPLNLLTDQPFMMREQFLTWGSWQQLCFHQTDLPGCAMRLSGWFGHIDWQLQLNYTKQLNAAVAMQTTLGNGGIVFAELHGLAQHPNTSLIELSPTLFQVELAPRDTIQWNLGAQWTTANNLTLKYEALLKDNGLNAQDWQAIEKQLPTEQAGLVAMAFTEPFAQQQHLIQVTQTFAAMRVENLLLVWPQANKSWLNEFTFRTTLSSTLDLALSWQHTSRDGVLSNIGKQDSLSTTLRFKDGF